MTSKETALQKCVDRIKIDILSKYDFDKNTCLILDYPLSTGYAVIGTEVDYHTYTFRVHRLVAFILHNFDINDTSIYVLHSCNRRSCINPLHLRLGTAMDNIQDVVLNGDFKKSHVNGIKSHCRRSHELTKDNLRIYIDSFGKEHRQCKRCYQNTLEIYNIKRIERRKKMKELGKLIL